MLKKFRHTEGLLARYARLVCDTVVPYQERAIRDEIEGVVPSYAIENFKNAAILNKTGVKPAGGDHKGCVFQDSDVAKWIEAAAYSLSVKPDAELEKRLDEVCELIGEAQEADGYLDTHFTLNRPKEKFTELVGGHELYCSGHMIEAAVALYEITGKKKLLDTVCKNADMLYRVFVTEGREGYPGHPEIELALLRLWRVTNEDRYMELAKHFIDIRGIDTDFFNKEYRRLGINIIYDNHYSQCHAPVRQQSDAVGHAVRAAYLYTAMADLAAITDDKELEDACFRLFESIEKRRMYITGGIGSSYHGEAFTADYDLPSDTAYTETCASIALIFFASKLLKLRREGRIADVMERALYNTVLAGIELDGKKFFYVNPLEVLPGISGNIPTHRHALPQRPGWYGCACCPPNTARLLGSVANYAWDEQDGILYSNLFASGELTLSNITLEVETDYPFGDTVKYKVKKGSTKLAIHIPAFTLKNYSVSAHGELKSGYYYLEVNEGDEVTVKVEMIPRLYRSNTRVASNSGKAAVMVGPVVYCAEEKDNGDVLGFSFRSSAELKLNKETPEQIGGFYSEASDLGAVYTVTAEGQQTVMDNASDLYFTDEYRKEEKTLKLIPYFMWGNRGLNQMRVWMPVGL